ncbi:hypothetical protein DV736_g2753, partial [Chaetothyriales sp. CBS 134916]
MNGTERFARLPAPIRSTHSELGVGFQNTLRGDEKLVHIIVVAAAAQLGLQQARAKLDVQASRVGQAQKTQKNNAELSQAYPTRHSPTGGAHHTLPGASSRGLPTKRTGLFCKLPKAPIHVPRVVILPGPGPYPAWFVSGWLQLSPRELSYLQAQDGGYNPSSGLELSHLCFY